MGSETILAMKYEQFDEGVITPSVAINDYDDYQRRNLKSTYSPHRG
jgi:hypothetical protein